MKLSLFVDTMVGRNIDEMGRVVMEISVQNQV